MNRITRHKRIRNKVKGTESRPRLSVFRSSKNLQVQLIDDESGRTLVGMSTTKLLDPKKTKIEEAKLLGESIAKSILGIENGKYKTIVFDRGGYRYHGRIKALADALREGGLEF